MLKKFFSSLLAEARTCFDFVFSPHLWPAFFNKVCEKVNGFFLYLRWLFPFLFDCSRKCFSFIFSREFLPFVFSREFLPFLYVEVRAFVVFSYELLRKCWDFFFSPKMYLFSLLKFIGAGFCFLSPFLMTAFQFFFDFCYSLMFRLYSIFSVALSYIPLPIEVEGIYVVLELFPVVVLIFSIVFCVVFLLGAIAFCTVFERKSIAVLQNRRGPNRAGFFGLLQAIGDGVKLVTKAQVSKKQTSTYLYFFAPFCALFLSWFFAFYLTFNCMDDFSIYYLLIWTSLNVYSVPVAGLVTSHSKFAFLGGVRSLSQLLSYELSLTVIFLTIVVYTGTPVLGEVVEFQVNNIALCFSMFPVLVLWFILLLAETNRVPFDLPEAEAELVAGFATEYSSFAFAAFFLAEYGSMLLYSYLTALLFFGSFNPFLLTVFLFFCFVWARTTFPRFKVDQLLWIGWSLCYHCH